MMFVDNHFFDGENKNRLFFGIAGAVLVHALVVVWFSMPPQQKIMSADIFSPPTNISIRFVTQQKEKPKPVVEMVKAEPIQKDIVKKVPAEKPAPQKLAKIETPKPQPVVLNKIEPAAAPAPAPVIQEKPVEPIKLTKPTPDVIPVISDANVKGRRVQPAYPKRALRMRQEGVVLLHVLIGEDGKRQDIKMQKPSQYALLNQAALKAVKKWTFDPNIVNGRAVRSWVEIPIEFKIQ